MTQHPATLATPDLQDAAPVRSQGGRGALGAWVVRRLAAGAVVVFVCSVVVFGATQALPADPAQAILGRDATPERLAALREELDLDRPMLEQYTGWLGGLVTGDLGTSLATREPVAQIIGPRLSGSLTLMLAAALVAFPVSVALGVLTALRRDGLLDRASLGTSLVLTALPEFVIAMLLVILFATTVFNVLPAVALIPAGSPPWTHPRELALPVLALVLAVVPALYRLVRGSMIDALDSDYAQMARLKGVPARRIAYAHAFPNAAVPTVQASGLMLGYLFSGTVVIEQVFRYPGLGTLMVDAVGNRDLPVIQVVTLLYATAVVVFSVATDLVTHLISAAGEDKRGAGMSDTAQATELGTAGPAALERVRRSTVLDHWQGRMGVILAGVLVVFVVVAPWLAPHRPSEFVGAPFQPADGQHWLGTDVLGRDVLSRVCWGGRGVLVMAALATVTGVGAGVVIGLVTAYSRSILSAAAMRLMDLLLAFPQLVLVLLFVSLLGPSAPLIVLLVALAWMPGAARVTRGVAVEELERDYVLAYEVIGLPRHRLLFRGVLPNLATPLLVEFALRLTWSIGVIAALSFLGFGVQPPNADWGLMISENRSGLVVQPWATVAPVLMLVLFTVGTNLIAEGAARMLAGTDRGARRP